MALKGAYNYAGINLTEAYVRVNSVHWKSNGDMEMVETKAAVFDKPGGARIVQPAEYGKRWVDKTQTNYTYSIYKDIFKLEPGQIVEINSQSSKLEKYKFN